MKTTLYFTMALVLMVGLATATIISDTDSTFTGNIVVSGNVDGVDVSALNTITGSVTAAEMDQIENIGANVISAAIWARVAGLDQAVGTGNAVVFTTVNTGQGANELYDMDQNVQTTSNVLFNKVNVTDSLIFPRGDVRIVNNTNTWLKLIGKTDAESTDANRNLAVYNLLARNVLELSGQGKLIFGYTATDKYIYYNSTTDALTIQLDAGAEFNITKNTVVPTLDTGQGANELYDMNQNVQTTSNVTFARANFSGYVGNIVKIDQNALNGPNNGALYLENSALSKTFYALRSSNDYTYLLGNSSSSTGTHYFFRQLASTDTGGPIVQVMQNSATDDQPALKVRSASTIKAPFNIHPQASAPTTCEIGDIYIDTSGAFCACSATNKWNNTIATGTCV